MAGHYFGETGNFPSLVFTSPVDYTHFVDIVDDPALGTDLRRLPVKLRDLAESF